jgi:2-methylcitrate dehydratase PrpD
MDALTRQASEFVARLSPDAIPDACLDTAAMGITDCVAVTIAGADEEAPRLVKELVSPTDGNDSAPVLGGDRLYAPADAALLNGVAGHVLDYDDVGIDGHPSVVLTPAILAEGWSLGSDGRRVLSAYVVGYEIWALLNALEPGQMHERGFHPTAVYGTVATAAACAHLRGLDAARSAHAIAIGASLASGLVANFGTMTKSLHAGRAAQSGVIAARLAARGYTGSSTILENVTGFMRAHSASGAPELDARDHALGGRWRITEIGLNIKRYPLCYSTHRAIDAMLAIVEEHDLSPDSVREIRVGAGRTQLLMLHNHEPKTGLEAKFSMEFAMASALIARRVGLSELTDEFVQRADVIEAIKKVRSREAHTGMVGKPDSKPDTVEVELTSGEILTHEPVLYARGSWQKPLTNEELRVKFHDCVAGRMAPDHAETLFRSLIGLAGLADLRKLPLARPASGITRRAV